jgi:twitching motility protein PilT
MKDRMTSNDPILRAALECGASDIFLTAGHPPRFRVHGRVTDAKLPVLGTDLCESTARALLGPARWATLVANRDVDFAADVPGAGRLRVNAHYQRGTVAIAIRMVHTAIRPLQSLGLPDVLARLARTTQGLILVTGGTGSGKSTTLAAMVDAINRVDGGHVITLEDPIEYRFEDLRACIEQREVGSDVPGFAQGLRHALRQDPDVIMVGEMRDLETTSAALTAAETGHLVLSSLHTPNAAQTVERIIDIYPSGQQNQVRTMLAGSLVAVVSQNLLPRKDRAGMVAAAEVMIATPAVKNCVRENRCFELNNLIETGRSAGMVTMDSSLRDLVTAGIVRHEDAAAVARSPERLRLAA